MKQFKSPLDNVRVASPCPANWDEMYGDDRKRFCGQCKLNVYNLSEMSRSEAESLLMQSEGRLCVKYYRRSDGTVLTRDCPVGWRAMRRRLSKTATAAFSLVAGLMSGLFAFNWLKDEPTAAPQRSLIPTKPNKSLPEIGQIPGVSSIEPIYPDGRFEVGRMVMGIPVKEHPQTKRTKLKTKLTKRINYGGVIEQGSLPIPRIIPKN